MLFGSDFPHPEGMADPLSFVDQLDGLPEDDKAKVMGGNLNRLMKVPVAASARHATLRCADMPFVDAIQVVRPG